MLCPRQLTGRREEEYERNRRKRQRWKKGGSEKLEFEMDETMMGNQGEIREELEMNVNICLKLCQKTLMSHPF